MELTAKKTYSKFGLVYTLAYWIYAALTTAIILILRRTGHDVGGYDQSTMIIDFALRFVLIYPLMYLSIKNLPKYEIKKNNLGFGGVIACMFITIALMAFANLIGIKLNGFFGKLTGQGQVNPILDVMQSMSPVLLITIVAIIGPIFEELLFRKILLDRIGNYGEVTAMLISGFMFGLYHGNLAQFMYATTIGCFFAFIYLRTGRIRYSILLHIMVNSLSTCLVLFVLKGLNLNEMMGYLSSGDMDGYMNYVQQNMTAFATLGFIGMFIILAIIVGIILMIVLRKKFVFEHHEEELEKGSHFSTAIMNKGMLLYILYFILTIVLMQFNTSIPAIVKAAFS